jgi:hypothetical protein
MVAKSKAKHSKTEESKLREAAQLVYDEATNALDGIEERSFASVAKVLMEAGQVLDETAPAKEVAGAADEVTERRHEREERVRAAQAALRAAQSTGPEPSN